MKIAVYDTYVPRKDGGVMHFDILVPEEPRDLNHVFLFGEKYLAEKGQGGQPLSSKECKFCHIGDPDESILADISSKGFSIIEMEGCNV